MDAKPFAPIYEFFCAMIAEEKRMRQGRALGKLNGIINAVVSEFAEGAFFHLFLPPVSKLFDVSFGYNKQMLSDCQV